MTYLQFHLVFILPPLLVLGALATRHGDVLGPRARWAAPLTALLALAYTTPWDNYLVWKGIWVYGPDRVIGVIGYVPIEEYLFFLLQPLMTGALLQWLLARRLARGPVPPASATVTLRFVVAAMLLAFAAAGWSWTAAALRPDAAGSQLPAPRYLYLGLILGWALPLAALMYLAIGHEVRRYARATFIAIAAPTLYLWVADRFAIGTGIWSIAEAYTTGLHLVGLPVEEAVFFLVTNILVVLGVLLFLAPGLPGFRPGWRLK
jgi:lycopene cyclase domain-containing protein